MKTQINPKQIAKTGGLLVIGVLLGWWIFDGIPPKRNGADEQIAANNQDNIVYICPMHPQVKQSEPGICPFDGMELIPVKTSEPEQVENPQALTMSPVAMKLADVATAEVIKTKAVNTIRLPGKVAVNERKIKVIPAYFPGRIEELYVNFTGAYIQEGDKLASVYAPKLITAQKELLQAYNHRKSESALYRAARQKLKNWELSEPQIDAIIQSGAPQTNFIIRSNKNGYVLDMNVEEGDYIKPGKPLLKLADLSNVWIAFQAYENDLAGLDTGDKVEFTIAALPGRTFEAEVTYIDPVLSEKTRTITIRTEVDNEKGLLKPNMLAKGVVSATLNNGKPMLQVPRSAVLWTGKRSIVYVKVSDSPPAFAAREVVLGSRVGNNYVILEGLQAGQRVVVQGNFMIDASAQLTGKLSMMNRNPESSRSSGMPGMNMPGMKMEQSSKGSEVEKVQVPEVFIKQLDKVVDAYLKIKNALTKDDLQAASLSVKGLQEALSKVDMSLIKDAQLMGIWMTQLNALKKNITALVQSGDIEGFRSQFALLSDILAKTLATFGVEQTLYVQFCPMAKAYWISAQKKIVNPYLGQMMPGCGETKQVIKPIK